MSTIIKEDNNKKPDANLTTDSDTTTRSRPDRSKYQRNKNLEFVADLSKYKVHHDDVDPRGYTVMLDGGEKIGEVEGLLADVPAKLVRYIEIEVEDNIIERHTAGHYDESDRHILVPAGLVAINKSGNSVGLRGLTLENMIDYPRFQKDQGYTTGYEIETNDYLSGFHEHGKDYDRNRYSTDTYRNSDALDSEFYNTGFYNAPRR